MEDEIQDPEGGRGAGAPDAGGTSGDGDPDDARGPGGRKPPAWLDLPADAAPDVRRVAGELAALLEGPARDGLPSARLEELAEARPARVLAAAVSRLHASLDGAGSEADGGPPDDARSRLCRLTEELWTTSVDAELHGYHSVLRDISHDIRSPLNSILFLVDGLYTGQSGELTDVQRQQIGVVYSAAASLLKLVNDLLDFARIAEGEGQDEVSVHRVPFSVRSVLTDVRRLVSPIAEHKDCEVQTEIDVSGPREGDPQVLSRVLVNLVSNAISAAGEEGAVRVRIEGDGDEMTVEVLDDGDDPDVEHLQQAVAARTDEEMKLTRVLSGQTQGLGLVICGRMVRQVGGELEVGRTPDGWTRFTVALPFGEG